MSAPRVNGLRARLHRRNPCCYWCGCLTSLTHGSIRSHSATIDHVYPRTHPVRVAARGRTDKVLACHKCNQDRNNADGKGRVFVPALSLRERIALKASIVAAQIIPQAPVSKPPVRQVPAREEIGWIDERGELRPRSWDEHCRMFKLPHGWPFHRRPVSKYQMRTLCTIGEAIAFAQQQTERA